MSKIGFGVGAIAVVVLGATAWIFLREPAVIETPDLPEVSYEDVVETPVEEPVVEEPSEVVEVPVQPSTEFLLSVPFTSQAPMANWSLPYQETCEEASSYMVAEFYKGVSGAISPSTADQAILDIVAFEEDHFGYYLDTTASETVELLDLYFGVSARVVENPTPEAIKAEIRAGRPVIVPTAGRELPNPNFSGEGPLYHMLVIKGFTESTFITNDPGTRNGNSFSYKIGDLMSAIGDWNNGDPASGATVAIFTAP